MADNLKLLISNYRKQFATEKKLENSIRRQDG